MTRIGFEGQAVIVTGAGAGIGRCHALDLARRGAHVVVNDFGTAVSGTGASTKPADAVVEEIRALGGDAVASYDSVATSHGGRGIVETCLDAFGRLDSVIHNAGILRYAAFDDLSDDDVGALLATHLSGAFNVGRPAFRHMRASGYGRFVFTTSGAGLFGGFHEASYMAAKAGLLGVNNAVAIEGAPFGIRSNCVLPMAFTRMADAATDPSHFRIEDASLLTGIEKLGDWSPEFVTPLVVYLASNSCSATQQAFSSVGNRYARVFVGATLGWYGPTESPATAEDISDHLDEMSDTTSYVIPTSVYDEGALAIKNAPN